MKGRSATSQSSIFRQGPVYKYDALRSLGCCFPQYNFIGDHSECCAIPSGDGFVCGFFVCLLFYFNLPYVNFKQNQNSRSFLAESMDGQEERGALKEGSDPWDLS